MVLARRIALDDEDETWEPVSPVLEDDPAVLKRELKRFRLLSDDKKKQRKRCGFSL